MNNQKPNFTPRLQQALTFSKQLAAELDCSVVSVDHISAGILHLRSGPCRVILESLGLDAEDCFSFVRDAAVIKNVLDHPAIDKKDIKYSTALKRCMAVALLLSERLEHQYVGSEHMLIAILKHPENALVEYLKFVGVDPKEVINKIKSHFLQEMEVETVSYDPRDFNRRPRRLPEPPSQSSQSSQMGSGTRSPLSSYCTNLNQAAISGDLDPVVGRESEIKDISEILCRKNKNNPILLGEAGVGKTAVAEGLAQQIASGSCTDFLLNKVIYSLDLASMVAGTKYRGQFEERLKSLMKELSSQENAILFIDEIHTLVGAGSAEGSMDAANILKPQLARGRLMCIGATTKKEYNKTIRKDDALARRFQPLKVEEPNKEDTLQILSAIKKSYQDFHNVSYRKDILVLAYDLASKYFPDRQFPDKAIDLMDQAGAKAKIARTRRPSRAVSLEKEIERLFDEEGKTKDPKKQEKLREQQEELFINYKDTLEDWSEGLGRCYVKKEHLYEIVSIKTGIPMKEINKSYSKKLLSLNESLKGIVIGQDHAIESVHKNLIRNKGGLTQGKKPLGSFLLLGSPGLGKTYLSKTMASYFFGGDNKLIHLDMSEFSEKQSASRLIGASPGYVGYEEGGLLVEKVRNNPYSVVLFDEIEKAHEDVFQLLLQILEEGRLTDNFGRSASFSNCLIMLTANLGSSSNASGSMGFSGGSDKEYIDEKIKSKAKEVFRPEFLDRLDDILIFNKFSDKDYLKIIDIELNKLRDISAKQRINLFFDKKVGTFLLNKVKSEDSGARPLLKLIQEHIELPYSIKHLSGKAPKGSTILFSEKDGEIVMKIS